MAEHQLAEGFLVSRGAPVDQATFFGIPLG
jgi:hypothetical protein